MSDALRRAAEGIRKWWKEQGAGPLDPKQYALVAALDGYEDRPCPECRQWKVVRCGDCRKCDSCGHVYKAGEFAQRHASQEALAALGERVAEIEKRLGPGPGYVQPPMAKP